MLLKIHGGVQFWGPISSVRKFRASLPRDFLTVGLCDFSLMPCMQRPENSSTQSHMNLGVFGIEGPGSDLRNY